MEDLERRQLLATWGMAWPMPRALTVSFVPDGTQVGAQVSNLVSLADALWGPDWRREVLEALQTWAYHADVILSVLPDSGDPMGAGGPTQGSSRFGDIRIAGIQMASDVLGIAEPHDPALGTSAGDVLLNTGYAASQAAGGAVDLYRVMLHEAGHIFGLPDSADPTSAMFAAYTNNPGRLSADDIAAVQRLYGPPQSDRGKECCRPDGFVGPMVPGAFANSLDVTPSSGVAMGEGNLGPSDILTYRHVASGAEPLAFRLQTSRLSLLTARLTIIDVSGQIVGSAASTDPLSGDLQVVVANPVPGSVYLAGVEGASGTVFDVGAFALTAGPASRMADAAEVERFRDQGFFYLLPTLTDGLPTDPAALRNLVNSLFQPGAGSSGSSAAAQSIVNKYLEELNTNELDTTSLNNLLGRLVDPDTGLKLEPGVFNTVLVALSDRGLIGPLLEKSGVSDILSSFLHELVDSGNFTSLMRQALESTAFSDLLRQMTDSGDLPRLIEMLGTDTGEANLLLTQLLGLAAGAFDGSPEQSSMMESFFRMLLDKGAMDAMLRQLVDDGSLAAMFQMGIDDGSLSPILPVLVRQAGMEAISDTSLAPLLAKLSTLDPGTIPTAGQMVDLVDALLRTGRFDGIMRGLMDSGAIDGLIERMWQGGWSTNGYNAIMASPEFSNMLVNLVLDGQMQTYLKLLWDSGDLGRSLRSFADSPAFEPMIQQLFQHGVLDKFLSSLVDSGLIDTLFRQLSTWSGWQGIMTQLIDSGLAARLVKAAVSSGLVRDVLGELQRSGELTRILDELLSSGAVDFNHLILGLLPTATDSSDQARSMYPLSYSQEGTDITYGAVCKIANSASQGYYRVTVPVDARGQGPGSMSVSVWRNAGTSSSPIVDVFDDRGNPVQSEVLHASAGAFVVQVADASPGARYVLRVRSDGSGGTSDPELFVTSVSFGSQPVCTRQIASGNLADGPDVTDYTASETQVVHWVFSVPSAGDGGEGTVEFKVSDAEGRVRFAQSASVGQVLSTDLVLDPGRYRITVTPTAIGSSLGYSLRGFISSSPIEPFLSDVTMAPAGEASDARTPQPESTGPGEISSLAEALSAPYLRTFGAEGNADPATLAVASGAEPLDASVFLAGEPGVPETVASPIFGQDAQEGRVTAVEVGLPVLLANLDSLRLGAGRLMIRHDLPSEPAPLAGCPTRILDLADRLGTEGFTVSDLLDPSSAELKRQLEAARAGQGQPSPESADGTRQVDIVIAVAAVAAGVGGLRRLDRRRRRGRRGAKARHPSNPMPSGFARGSASHKAILIAPPNGDRDHSSLRGWLQEEGLGVETRGGSAAVRCSDPDLIILIHDPPRFDGMAVLRRVISRSADHALVAIVVSDSRPVSAEESLGLAHMDLLPSRPGRDAFRNSVESALRMRRRLVELEDRADRDGLTGLANRHALERRLAMECLRHRESGEPLTLLMADLDLFKQVNDRHGHLVGDELLRGVAAEFLRSVRESDFVARYGGEEFVILAPDCDAICGEVLAERTRRRIAELPLAELRLEHPVTLSLGAVTADSRQDMVPDLLLYRADHALYEAKTAGRNAVRIWSELTHPTLSR